MTTEGDKATRKVPDLRFPEFSAELGWEEKRLGDVLDYERPDKYIVSDTNYVAAGIPVLTANKSFILGYTNETEGIYKDVPAIIFDDFTTDKKFVTFPFKVKSSAIKILRTKKHNSPRLVAEMMLQINFEATEHKRYYISEYQNIKLFLPDKDEQEKVADCLFSIDELIAAQAQNIEALKAHKKGLIRQLFPADGETVPHLRFSEFQNGEDWKIFLLGNKAAKVGSGITPYGGEATYKSSGRMFVRSQNIGWGRLLLKGVAFIDEATHRKFPETELIFGDVLLNITGASIGRSAVADHRLQGGNVNQHVCIIRTKKGELDPYFLNQYLLSASGQAQIDSFQAGGNRQGLNFSQIRAFSLPLPSIGEQEKIATLLTSLDALIETASQKQEAQAQHKRGLIQRLFPSIEKTDV